MANPAEISAKNSAEKAGEKTRGTNPPTLRTALLPDSSRELAKLRDKTSLLPRASLLNNLPTKPSKTPKNEGQAERRSASNHPAPHPRRETHETREPRATSETPRSNPTQADTQQDAALKRRLLGALARREHSYRELLDKYSQEGGKENLMSLLDELATRGWQSDERYLKVQIRQAIARGKGPLWIRQKLRSAGVSAHAIEEALVACDFGETLQRVYQKRFPQPTQDPKERARRTRFLLSRGFTLEQIQKLLKS